MSLVTKHLVHLLRGGHLVAAVTLDRDVADEAAEDKAAMLFATAEMILDGDTVRRVWTSNGDSPVEHDGSWPIGVWIPEEWFRQCGADCDLVETTDLDFDDAENVRVSAGDDEGAYCGVWAWAKSHVVLTNIVDEVPAWMDAFKPDQGEAARDDHCDDAVASAERVVSWWSDVVEEAFEEEVVGLTGFMASAFRSHPSNDVAVESGDGHGNVAHALMRVAAGDLYVIAGEEEICVYDARRFGSSVDECRKALEGSGVRPAPLARRDIGEVLPIGAGVGPRFR